MKKETKIILFSLIISIILLPMETNIKINTFITNDNYINVISKGFPLSGALKFYIINEKNENNIFSFDIVIQIINVIIIYIYNKSIIKIFNK